MSTDTSVQWSLLAGLPDWLLLPVDTNDRAQWRLDAGRALAAIADIDEELRSDPDCLRPGAPLDIDDAIASLLDFAAALPQGQRLVAGLTIPGRWPLPVIVDVRPTGDDPQDLLAAAGARGGFESTQVIGRDLREETGTGIRVTRFDLDDDGALRSTVRCARRQDGSDTVLTWSTVDLELVTPFIPHLDRLLGLVRIGRVR